MCEDAEIMAVFSFFSSDRSPRREDLECLSPPLELITTFKIAYHHLQSADHRLQVCVTLCSEHHLQLPVSTAFSSQGAPPSAHSEHRLQLTVSTAFS